MTALTVQHVLRDLFRRIPAYAAPTAEPEERLNRPRQYAAGGSWNVQTVETYSCEEHKKCDPARVWKLPIPCVQPSEYEPYSVDFTHFIDGTQRTSRVCEIPWQAEGSSTVPVLVAQIACIALERVGRQVRLCPDISRSKTLVEMPIRFLSRNATKAISQAVAELPTHSSFEWVDTSYDTRQSDDNNGAVLRHPDLRGCYEAIPDSEFKQALVDPNWLCNQSRKWTAKHRDALEQRVFEQLAQDYGKVSTDGVHLKFFVRDGTLTSVRGKFVKSAVGLSKSFNTRFLDPHLQTRVLHLPPYHRTPVFKFERDARGTEPDEVESEEEPKAKSPQKHTVLSWYVRIRKPNLSVPYWGLLRVEIHPSLLPSKGSADRWAEDDSRMVSAISAAVVKEANPTSQPDPRWHNLLYPIRLCEAFARSKMIPHDTVKYLFMSGGKSYD